MPPPFADFYRGKRVFVTGHTGFQGGWLVAWLKLLGAKVCGYGLPPSTRPNFFDATLLDRGITSVFGDVRDYESLANAFAESQPEIVFHTAAQSLPRPSHGEPVETFATNVMGTIHVLEEARLTNSVRAVVIVTSGSCYENRDWFWSYREEDALGGSDSYSSSMACAEVATSAYIREFFHSTKTAAATARTGNLIGGGDWAEDRLVPGIVRAMASRQPVTIGVSQAAWPWQHVLEAVGAYLLLAQRLHEGGQSYSGPWNFGPHDEDVASVRQLTENVIKLWGAGEVVLAPNGATPREPSPIRLNTRKAKMQLGWAPSLRLNDALAWTIDWYRAFNAEPASAWRTTEDQIQQFMRRATVKATANS